MSQSVLAIGDATVRQLDGLYSLNDLHTAAGGAIRHQPTRFMRLDQTQAIIAELHSPEMVNGQEAVKVIKGSVNPGTWVCRELVIAYAAWISAAFHLKVIRVFLAAQSAHEHFITEPTAALERALQSGRWFMSADDGHLTLKPVRSDAYVITEEQLASVIREPGGVSLRLLPEIIAAAAKRLVNCTSIGGQS
jgi:hypothetical protein